KITDLQYALINQGKWMLAFISLRKQLSMGYTIKHCNSMLEAITLTIDTCRINTLDILEKLLKYEEPLEVKKNPIYALTRELIIHYLNIYQTHQCVYQQESISTEIEESKEFKDRFICLSCNSNFRNGIMHFLMLATLFKDKQFIESLFVWKDIIIKYSYEENVQLLQMNYLSMRIWSIFKNMFLSWNNSGNSEMTLYHNHCLKVWRNFCYVFTCQKWGWYQSIKFTQNIFNTLFYKNHNNFDLSKIN